MLNYLISYGNCVFSRVTIAGATKICTSVSKYSKNMASSGTTEKLDSVADVDIDEGRFKYILIKVHDSIPDGEETSKFIVRGYSWAGYHADIYEKVEANLVTRGLEGECVGGGRILHDRAQKTIKVYGYSQGYGRADHKLATDILKKRYGDYAEISWSNDGY